LKGEGKKFSFATFNENHHLFPSHPAPEKVFTEMSVFSFFFVGLLESREVHLFIDKIVKPH